MRQQHLKRLASIHPCSEQAFPGPALYIPPEDDHYIFRILEKNLGSQSSFVVLSPFAASYDKRWALQKFACLADEIILRTGKSVLITGDKNDRELAQALQGAMSHPAIDLTGQTTLVQFAALLRRADLLISNDSGPMHMGSYLQIPVVGIFGPTDPVQYRPWSTKSCFVERKKECPSCQNPQRGRPHECLIRLEVGDVLEKLTLEKGTIGFKNERKLP